MILPDGNVCTGILLGKLFGQFSPCPLHPLDQRGAVRLLQFDGELLLVILPDGNVCTGTLLGKLFGQFNQFGR